MAVSHYHTITVSHYHTMTVSQYHSITLSHYDGVTVSHYHSITLSHNAPRAVCIVWCQNIDIVMLRVSSYFTESAFTPNSLFTWHTHVLHSSNVHTSSPPRFTLWSLPADCLRTSWCDSATTLIHISSSKVMNVGTCKEAHLQVQQNNLQRWNGLNVPWKSVKQLTFFFRPSFSICFCGCRLNVMQSVRNSRMFLPLTVAPKRLYISSGKNRHLCCCRSTSELPSGALMTDTLQDRQDRHLFRSWEHWCQASMIDTAPTSQRHYGHQDQTIYQ